MYNHATFLLEDFQGKLGEDGERRLHRMIKLGQRMEKLIADLLYFSRLGRGEQAVERIDLNGMIAEIEAHLAETLKARQARITVPEHLPSIDGHPAQMITLFQNLIINGVKYNDAPEKIIEIGLIPASGDSATSMFETLYVRDNGIGIDQQFNEEIFRIFKRLNSEKAYGEGTGAGLTFAKKIVENHGGRIWIESEIGKGTTIFMTLPTKIRSSSAGADDAAA
jgi:light-regulated signal transduction histidine kinase (bacteriophytochrome)